MWSHSAIQFTKDVRRLSNWSLRPRFGAGRPAGDNCTSNHFNTSSCPRNQCMTSCYVWLESALSFFDCVTGWRKTSFVRSHSFQLSHSRRKHWLRARGREELVYWWVRCMCSKYLRRGVVGTNSSKTVPTSDTCQYLLSRLFETYSNSLAGKLSVLLILWLKSTVLNQPPWRLAAMKEPTSYERTMQPFITVRGITQAKARFMPISKSIVMWCSLA